MKQLAPSVDTLLRRAREKRVRLNLWSATVVHDDRVVVSVDGDGNYDVGTRAKSLATGPRRVVVPVLEKLLGETPRSLVAEAT